MDNQVWGELLRGDEDLVWADTGYVNTEREAEFKAAVKIWGVMRKAPKGGDMHPLDARINRIIASVRAKIEQPFRVIKRQFGHVNTRCRGLAKNCAQLFTSFALGNLFLVRRMLMACGRFCPKSTDSPQRRSREREIGRRTPILGWSSRSVRQLGATEAVDQKLLK